MSLASNVLLPAERRLGDGRSRSATGSIGFFGDRLVREHKTAWHHMVGNVLVVLLHVANWLIREEPGNADVLPTGLFISAGVSVIFLYTGWRGWELVYRHRTGVAEEDERGRP